MGQAVWLILVAIVAAAAAAIAAMFFARRGRGDDGLSAAVTGLAAQQRDLFARMDQLSGTLGRIADEQSTRHDSLTQQFNERLEQVSQRVGQTLTEQGVKTTESLTQLKERLLTIDAAQKNITELSKEVVSLQDILANKQARGAFGQIQMEDIVRKALPPSVYAFQYTLTNNKRCDCIIHLPQPPGSIVIDAKFPLEPFFAVRAAKSEAETKEAARLFRSALLKHIEDIGSKYILSGETAESALMFLPSEAVYAELHASFQDVVEKSHSARVYIVSPTTLMATLNTVRAVLKDARMREQAHVIQKEVGKLAGDIGRLTDRVGNLRTHFTQAEKDIKEIETSASKVSRTAERIEEIQLEEADAGAANIEPPRPRLEAIGER